MRNDGADANAAGINGTTVESRLAFLRAAEALKNVLRSSHTSSGRRESTAEHSWRLSLMALVFEDQLPDLDLLKVLKLCVVHDLTEAIHGDIPAIARIDPHAKNAQERRDLLLLTAPLDTLLRDKLLALWEDYEQGTTPEAKAALFAKMRETIDGGTLERMNLRPTTQTFMNDITIRTTSPREFDAIADIWEASVKATHHFLGTDDIAALRPLVRNDYLPLVDLRVAVDGNDAIQGFVGVADGKVEMLFIAPGRRGRGTGTALLRHAIGHMGAGLVDVNEQNPDAVGFYESKGFEVVGRSPVDGQGRPFPLLHMRFKRGE